VPIPMHPLDFLASIFADDDILGRVLENHWPSYTMGYLRMNQPTPVTEESEDYYQCPFCEREQVMQAIAQLTSVSDDVCTFQCDLTCQECPYELTVYGILREPCPEGQARGELRLEPWAIGGQRVGQG
jgi:transcription elongation factor Elf1